MGKSVVWFQKPVWFWICPECETENIGSNVECKKCGFKRKLIEGEECHG